MFAGDSAALGWWPATVLAIIAVLVLVEFLIRLQPAYQAAKSIPGEYIWPVIGNSLVGLKLYDNVLSFQHALEMARTFKRGYRFFVLNQLHYWPILSHEVEFLFNSSKNADKSFIYRFLIPVLGEGLLVSNGPKWAHRRRILTPAFHFNILQTFLHTFREESGAFVARLASEDGRIDGTAIHDVISRFTLNNICETAMGVRLNSATEPDNYRDMIKRSGSLLVRRFLNPFTHPEWVYKRTGLSREIHRCASIQHNFSGTVISQRRQSRSLAANEPAADAKLADVDDGSRYTRQRYAMLDTLLEAEAAGHIDADGIQEEVDTFMFEGYDTTSAALEFCLFTLAVYTEHQSQVYEELRSLVAGNGGSSVLSVDQYAEMRYLDLVIKETMRLYPPVPYLSRELTEPVDLGYALLPTGTPVHVHVYNLHRDPAQFPQPERFDPERFLPENSADRHPFAYIPFSAGTRNCIGQKFAMLEIKCLLASLLLEYRLETVTKPEELEFYSDLVLKTVKPIRVRFVRRCETNVK